MGVVRGDFLHQIGAGFQVVKENLAAGVGGVLSEQVAVMPDLKGHVRHGRIAGQVVFENTQGGPRPVGNGQNGIVLGGRIVGVNVDAVGGLVQHIPGRGGGFHHLNIGFLPDAGHTGHAGIVGGHGSDELAIGVHVKGGVTQGNAGLLVHLDDGQADVPHVLPSNENVLGAVPLHRFHAGGLHIAVRGRLLRDAVGAVGQLVSLKGDGAVKAGDAGSHIGAVNLLKAENSPLQTALVLRVHLFDRKALFRFIRHRHIGSAASGQGDVHGGHDLVALRGGGFRQRELLIGGEVAPYNLAVAVCGSADSGALVARQRELGALQRGAARTRFNNLEAGSFGQIIHAAPFEVRLRVTGGIAGVGDDIGLLRGGGVVGQKQVELGHAPGSLDGEGAFVSDVINRDADLKGTVILASIGVKIGAALLAGVHLIAGGPVLLHGFQRRIVLRHKNGALGGVGGVHLGLAPVNPGGSGRSHIHHAGVILLPVDGFLFDAVLTAGGSAL